MGGQVDLNSLGDTLRRQYAAMEPALAVRVANAGRLLTVLPATREATARPRAASEEVGPCGSQGQGASNSMSRWRGRPQGLVSSELRRPRRSTRLWLWRRAGASRCGRWRGRPATGIVVRLRLGETMDGDDARRLLQTVERAIAP